MRKRKLRQAPTPVKSSSADRMKVVASLASAAYYALRLGEWFWTHWF